MLNDYEKRDTTSVKVVNATRLHIQLHNKIRTISPI